MRHCPVSREYDPKRGVFVTTLAYEYTAKHQVPEHAHGSDQLIYAVSGVMEVSSGKSTWLIPPQFGLWIRARTSHRIRMPAAVSMRTLYLRPGLVREHAADCAVLHVSPLLRELVLEAVKIGRLREKNPYECALRDVILRQIEAATPVPLLITLPSEQRALAVARAVMAEMAHPAPLAALCARAGVSVRTMQRIFRRDAGMDFESWRRQLRLTKAIELLAAGCSVKEAAFRVGYAQPGAFVQVFRRTLGATPKRWMMQLQSRGD